MDERGFLGTKIGGRLAVLLPCDVPNCASCGRQMRFLLQLSLGKWFVPFRMAVVFICPDPFEKNCPAQEPGGGANAVVLLMDLASCKPNGMACSRGPHRVMWEEWPEFSSPPVLGGTGFRERDAIQEREWFAFEERFGMTKLGGYAMYIYSDTEPPMCPACGGEMSFAASFDSRLPGEDCFEEFGDCGVGYLYLCDARCSPRGGAFLWQSS